MAQVNALPLNPLLFNLPPLPVVPFNHERGIVSIFIALCFFINLVIGFVWYNSACYGAYI